VRPAEPRSGARTRPLDAIGGEIRSVVRVGGVLLTPHPLPRGERGGWGSAPHQDKTGFFLYLLGF